jgi:hemerythrin-like metal-binding protein
MMRAPPIPKLIEWKPVYTVNIHSIDSQHRLLVSIIGHLQEAMLEGKTKQIVAPLFGAMNRYTEYHFEFEEQLLESNGYPGLESHRAVHAKLVEQLKDLEIKYLNGTLQAGAPLMHFLRTWLLDHICVHDKEYGAFLREKGVT